MIARLPKMKDLDSGAIWSGIIALTCSILIILIILYIILTR